MTRRPALPGALARLSLLLLVHAAPLAAQTPELSLDTLGRESVSMDFSPDGERLAEAALDRVAVRDLATGEVIFEAVLDDLATDVTFGASPDEIVVAMRDAGARRFDLSDSARPERAHLPGTWTSIDADGAGGVFGEDGAYELTATAPGHAPVTLDASQQVPVVFDTGQTTYFLVEWRLSVPDVGTLGDTPPPGAVTQTAALLYRNQQDGSFAFAYYDFGRRSSLRSGALPAGAAPQLKDFRETPAGPRLVLWVTTDSGERVVVYDPAADTARLAIDLDPGRYRRHAAATLTRSGTGLALQRPDGGIDLFATEDATAPLVPPRASVTAPAIALSQGHAATILDIAVAPQGDVLATVGFDGRVHLWDARSTRQLRSLAEGDSIEAAGFSPDGQSLMTFGFEQTLWNVADGRRLLSISAPNRTLGTWLGDSGEILLCGTAACARGRPEDFVTRSVPSTDLPEPVTNATLRGTAASPDGSRAAFLLAGGRFLLIDTATMRYSMREIGQPAEALALTDTGLAVAGTQAGVAVLYDLSEARVRRQLKVTDAPIARITPVEGGTVLLSVHGAQRMEGPDTPPRRITLDTETGRSAALPPIPAAPGTGNAGPVAFAAATGRLHTVAQTGARMDMPPQIATFSLPDRRLEAVTRPAAVAPAHIAFSADGGMLYVDGPNRAVHWDMASGKAVRTRPGGYRAQTIPAGDGAVYLGQEGERDDRPFFASRRQGERALAAEVLPGGYGSVVSPQVTNGLSFLLHIMQEDGVHFARFDLAAVAAGATEPEARFSLPGPPDYGEAFMLSPDGTLLLGHSRGRLRAADARTGAALWTASFKDNPEQLGFSADGGTLFVTTDSFHTSLLLVDTASGAATPAPALADDPDLSALLALDRSGVALPLAHDGRNRIVELDTAGRLTGRGTASVGAAPERARLDDDHRRVLLIDAQGPRTLLWDRAAETSTRLHSVPVGPEGVAFSPDGSLLAVAETSGLVSLWRGDGAEVARLAMFPDGGWAVVGPDGRYDSSDPGDMPALGWVLPDAPREALPIELFFREYFEPALLPRLLAGETFQTLPPIEDLNRAQPLVAFDAITPDPETPGALRVRLSLRAGGAGDAAGGVSAVKLFRDGQLVGQTEGVLIAAGDAASARSVTFGGILVPEGGAPVDFSAYGFNADGIKSATIRRQHRPDAGAAAPRTAYVISIGVDSHENPSWDLGYATADAALSAEALAGRLGAGFDRVVPVTLLSSRRLGRAEADRASIEAVLRRLAGDAVPDADLARIPGASALAQARPGDLVYLFFAGHGFAAPDGRFHLFPQDIGPGTGRTVDARLLSRTLDSERLARLFRRIQAEDLVLVIDACNSAASVEGLAFKPGPMGSRGLGQLAYDKGMRVLTASQAEGVALESAVLRHGALSYAMFHEGIEDGAADRAPEDGRLTLAEMLHFAEARVPALYAEITEGSFTPATRGGINLAVVTGEAEAPRQDAYLQRPSLFDFRDSRRAEAIYLGGGGPD
ncbi:hypothetical protein [Pseudooceanicola nanhaiensis]|uniref:hypothetical protein n=1 Tax=Pseudooceanicola nanhaiensis TaxID=375761 RepID=UPI004058823C